MSATGIALFYGAEDPATAIAEVTDGKNGCATVGCFTSTQPLTVIDLTSLPYGPSLFDAARRHLRSPLEFLRTFAEEVSQSTDGHSPEEREVAYVPTQIVTDYFRHLRLPGTGKPVHGIRYRSARQPDAVCLVLFMGPEDCLDADPGVDGLGPKLVLRQVAIEQAAADDFSEFPPKTT